MSNLPKWPGASAVYSKTYRRLEIMAQQGHITRSYHRGRYHCTPSQEMTDLIHAIDRGDEETIKAALLFPNYSS